jgi:hypothetical protein
MGFPHFPALIARSIPRSPAEKRLKASSFLRRKTAEKGGISPPFWRITPPGYGKEGDPEA